MKARVATRICLDETRWCHTCDYYHNCPCVVDVTRCVGDETRWYPACDFDHNCHRVVDETRCVGETRWHLTCDHDHNCLRLVDETRCGGRDGTLPWNTIPTAIEDILTHMRLWIIHRYIHVVDQKKHINF